MEGSSQKLTHYVYEIENLVNGKKYIGKHSTSKDINNDGYWGSGVLIQKAIKKYGIDNFKKRIVKICESEENAYKCEEEEIEKVKAYDSPNYYNIAKGGKGVFSGFKNTFKPAYSNKDIIVLNAEKYIIDLTKDFDNCRGSIFFKLKYYAGYLIYKNKSEPDILIGLDNISKRCKIRKKYPRKGWNRLLLEAYEIQKRLSFVQLEMIYNKQPIDIYYSELDFINSLEDKCVLNCNEERKVALMALIVYKRFTNRTGQYVKCSDIEILHLLNYTIRKEKRIELFNELEEKGFIKFQDDSFYVPYCKNDKSDIFMNISNISLESILVLDLYNGDNSVMECEKCRCLIKINKTRTKRFCKTCITYHPFVAKNIQCVDCGAIISVNSHNTKSCRCEECQKKADREKAKLRQRKRRMKTSKQNILQV